MKKEALITFNAAIETLKTAKQQYNTKKHLDACRSLKRAYGQEYWCLLGHIESAIMKQGSDSRELTEEEEQKLVELNATLVDLEKKIKKG